MIELLNNPAFQSIVVPSLAMVILWRVLTPAGKYRTGIALTASFTLVIALTIGLQLSPLTATRKIVILGGLFMLLGILIDYLRVPQKVIYTSLLVAMTAAALWLISPLLDRSEGMAFLTLIVSTVIFTLWVGGSCLQQYHSNQNIRLIITLAVFGLALGTSAIFGASALLGQLALAMGSILLVIFMLFLLGKISSHHLSFLLPAIVILILIGIAAVGYARLPWQSLAVLALIPLVERPPLSDHGNRWLGALWIASPIIVTGIIATQIARELAGGSAY